MNKYKVTRKFAYAGVAEVTAPNLEAAEELAKDIDGSEFIEQEDSEDSYIYSVTPEPWDEVRRLMDVHCLLCLAIFPKNSTGLLGPYSCPNCGNANQKQIVHLQEKDNE